MAGLEKFYCILVNISFENWNSPPAVISDWSMWYSSGRHTVIIISACRPAVDCSYLTFLLSAFTAVHALIFQSSVLKRIWNLNPWWCHLLLQDYKRQFENSLQLIEEERQKLLVAEQRWVDNWKMSVQKVQELYWRDTCANTWDAYTRTDSHKFTKYLGPYPWYWLTNIECFKTGIIL